MKHSRFLFASSIAALLATACLPAQRVAAYAPGLISEAQPPSVLTTSAGPMVAYPTMPPLPAPPVAAVSPGDSTFASFAGLNMYTNGFIVTSTPTVSYPPAAAPLPPLPIPIGLIVAMGGPATGMAYDALTGTLYLTASAGIVVGVSPSPGMPIVVSPFPIPFTTAPIAGLEFDAMTGLLLAVDVTATVYPFLATGAAAGPAIVPTVPPPAVPGDVAIDKTGKLNSASARPIYVAAGSVCYDITLPAPVFFPHGGGAATTGLAFQPMPAQSAPFGGCSCGGMTPTVGVTSAMVAGNPGFGLTLGGVAPASLVLFAFDFGFDPAFPLFNVTGCGLGLIPGSPTLVSAITFSDSGGVATSSLPLTVLPGFGPIYSQAFTLCSADPAGFAVAPMQRIVASGL